MNRAVLKTAGFDVQALRRDFPILHQQINGQPLVYLDNAATTHKPVAVIDALADYYRTINSNVHRGAHSLSDRSTSAFEQARDRVARFINSPAREQLIWTRGTTESINLVAACFARPRLRAGDRILVSGMAHHSNIVPWQIVAAQCGATVVPIPVTAEAELDFDALRTLLDARTRIVALEHVSNALGTVHPVAEIIRLAHAAGAQVLLDGAQAVAHMPVDVQALDADFYAFSGHKMFGPTGIGALYGKREWLESMPPYQSGGEMIETVSFSGTRYARLPYRFEAGTPHIAGAVGLGAAVSYLEGLDRVALATHEGALLALALELANDFPGFRLIGRSASKIGVLSFLLEGAHPHDVGTLLDQQGVAVRTGHHCAQPVMEHFAIPGTIRASFSIYNTLDEVERLFAALHKVRSFL
ncbi:MAG: cysteine desulfurase [Gammaproteobacteria bacterium]|jgi:cysteine desulfurase/selenocysteine lyase|nr:cysteine desulfurase [Gammaproteobacteria bacterium]MBP6050576.1 cysteine desulfurase [Pseudomonadales bacterium]MBK6583423.1 cysteine desulfurase [Gammaproteobacteria bacterium]MBK7168957.1 cysteine desulfurase [Gammaproteobacteria bacterium]MBK7521113.1 cysteine desulfurase [Gammaproteobacteria bacterium]